MSSKVTIKKNLIVFHNEGDWSAIYSKILADFGIGMAVRTRLRRELGFTYRSHERWIEFDTTGDRVRRYMVKEIHLDFYDEQAQSWFQLKYLNV